MPRSLRVSSRVAAAAGVTFKIKGHPSQLGQIPPVPSLQIHYHSNTELSISVISLEEESVQALQNYHDMAGPSLLPSLSKHGIAHGQLADRKVMVSLQQVLRCSPSLPPSWRPPMCSQMMY